VKVEVISASRSRPRQSVVAPGWPSPWHPRESPSLATMRIASPSGGGYLGRVGGAVVMAVQGLPFSLLEEYRTGNIRGLASELGQTHHPPGDHQIDGEAGLQVVGITEAAIFEAAATFEGAMKDLDIPVRGILTQALQGVFQDAGRDGGDEPPFDCFAARWWCGLMACMAHSDRAGAPLRRLGERNWVGAQRISSSATRASRAQTSISISPRGTPCGVRVRVSCRLSPCAPSARVLIGPKPWVFAWAS